MIHIKTVYVRVGNKMDVGTKYRGIDEKADRGKVTVDCDVVKEIV